jgi:hypothetical protein
MFVATSFVQATNPACLPVIDVAPPVHMSMQRDKSISFSAKQAFVRLNISSPVVRSFNRRQKNNSSSTISVSLLMYLTKSNKVARLATSVDSSG